MGSELATQWQNTLAQGNVPASDHATQWQHTLTPGNVPDHATQWQHTLIQDTILSKVNAMSQSLSKLYVHAIFHVKYNQSLIRPEDDEELYTYIGGVIKLSKSIPIMINGIENHIHVLCIMSKNICLADLMEDIKRNSSRWIKTKGIHYKDFAWQGGYSGYSVSPGVVDVVKKYVENQKSHHKKQTFKDEYLQLLKDHDVDYDETYLWT